MMLNLAEASRVLIGTVGESTGEVTPSAPASPPEVDGSVFADIDRAAERILGRAWTKEQLLVVAETDREVQHYPDHMRARITLANKVRMVDARPIRSMIAETMGGVEGTYYMTAALQLAQLAILFRQNLTATQYALLIAPLEAAEQVDDFVPTNVFVRERISHWRREQSLDV